MAALIKTGLAHVQFETIHPFLDGNGRIGRMLIILMLVDDNLLDAPILYPSYFFKKHHLEYYQRLDRVRTHGDFEGWISFYITAIRDSCIDAYNRAKDIQALQERLIKILNKETSSNVAIQHTALSFLFTNPVVSITKLSEHLTMAYNTAHKIIAEFIDNGILVPESKAAKRGKLFIFKKYLDILEKNYE